MKRLVMMFMWLVVFVILLAALDQILLRYRGLEQPFLRDVQKFHADFRRRLFGLPQMPTSGSESAPVSRPESKRKPELTPSADANVEAVVEREIARATQQTTSSPKTETEEGSLRYIYLDAEQNIQFAERYEEIPPQFRDAVQVVGE